MADSDDLSIEFYNKILDKDNITGEWFLTSTPIPVLSILALYLWFVLSLGPRLMASRQPYQMTGVMRLYNVVQVLHNGYIFSAAFIYTDFVSFLFNTSCSIKGFGIYESEKSLLLFYAWHYLVSKILDLLDTIFMVLRKKNISFLHIYHHTVMVFCFWLTLSYLKTFQGTLVVAINVFVHIIMYTYFFLATFPRLKPYLWWKKHLTKLQIVQFLVALAYLCLLYYFDCPISQAFTYLWLSLIFSILLLFVNFYIRTYVFPASSDESVKDKIQ